jgi:hypothetical protein
VEQLSVTHFAVLLENIKTSLKNTLAYLGQLSVTNNKIYNFGIESYIALDKANLWWGYQLKEEY